MPGALNEGEGMIVQTKVGINHVLVGKEKGCEMQRG